MTSRACPCATCQACTCGRHVCEYASKINIYIYIYTYIYILIYIECYIHAQIWLLCTISIIQQCHNDMDWSDTHCLIVVCVYLCVHIVEKHKHAQRIPIHYDPNECQSVTRSTFKAPTPDEAKAAAYRADKPEWANPKYQI